MDQSGRTSTPSSPPGLWMVSRPPARSFLTAAARDGAGGRARRQGPSRAALPDADLQPVPGEDTRELHVRAVRKRRVRLDPGPELPDLVVVELLREDDAVRVSHRDARHREEAVAHLERNGDDLAVRAMHGNLGRTERRVPHLDRHLVDALADEVTDGLHDAALRLDPHRRLPEATALPEVLREDPEAVAGLLGLAPVRVEDPQPDVGDAATRSSAGCRPTRLPSSDGRSSGSPTARAESRRPARP